MSIDSLQVMLDLESYLGYELDSKTGDDVIDYANDDPIDTSPNYLAELFSLKTKVPRPPADENLADAVNLLERIISRLDYTSKETDEAKELIARVKSGG